MGLKKIMLLTMKHGKVGYMINDFLSNYNKISKSTFSHPRSNFLATAKVGLAHYDSFRGGESHKIKKKKKFI